MTGKVIVSLDQGTSSTRAIVYDLNGQRLGHSQKALISSYPEAGFVEQCAETIWSDCVLVIKKALVDASVSSDAILAMGITNQRETAIFWDKDTDTVIGPAIVWSDRRTKKLCEERAAQEPEMREKSGLFLDPYFSASKISWVLTHNEQAKVLAKQKRLLFGTVDSFLIWRFSRGQAHVTDTTNAHRTLLLNLKTRQWDPELLRRFNVPIELLATVKPSDSEFAVVDSAHFGHAFPIIGVMGDQHAALLGHRCDKPLKAKITYGTGGFLLSNVGSTPPPLTEGLLSTVAFELQGQCYYALEGSMYAAGKTVDWVSRQLGLAPESQSIEPAISELKNNGGVYLVPAFTGLASPYWDNQLTASVLGLTFDTTKAHMLRAAVEASVYLTADVIKVMDTHGLRPDSLYVDGGMCANRWFLQCLADMLNIAIYQQQGFEITAKGIFNATALGCQVLQRLEQIDDSPSSVFYPDEKCSQRMGENYHQWKKAVQATKTFAAG